MEELISIIVPIYKVEAYLERCVKSICAQTYKNLEILLIDDGSPDKCPSMCDQYAKEDDRIKVIHKKNGGLADARNVGIENAAGSYIGFVDSDDYIHPYMYEKLLNVAKKQKSDLVICDLINVRDEDAVEQEFDRQEYDRQQEIQLSRLEAQEIYFNKEKRILYTVAWNKLYKKELFEKIRYPKGKVHEDEYTTYKLLYEAKQISYVQNAFYYYVTRESSIMGQFSKSRFDLLEAYRGRMEFYVEKNQLELYKRMMTLYMRMTAQYIKWMKMAKIRNGDILIKQSNQEFKRLYAKNKSKVKLEFINAMECFIFRKSISVYFLMWKIKHS